MTKWRRLPHWVYDGVFLGSDEHGDWIGLPAGTHYERPGAAFDSPNAALTLAPAAGLDERGWVAAFHAPGGTWTMPVMSAPVEVYVDITTPPKWDGATLRAVDLDLDVIRGTSGRVWIDDEDEFAQHRHTLGYPDVVIAHATLNCDRVHDAVASRQAPFDGVVPERWFAALAALTG